MKMTLRILVLTVSLFYIELLAAKELLLELDNVSHTSSLRGTFLEKNLEVDFSQIFLEIKEIVKLESPSDALLKNKALKNKLINLHTQAEIKRSVPRENQLWFSQPTLIRTHFNDPKKGIAPNALGNESTDSKALFP